MSQFDYGFGSPRVEISLDSRGALAVPHMGAYIVKGVTIVHFYLYKSSKIHINKKKI